ncbi:hypothetical protein ACIHFC_23950 [Streptomyces sp. NPDC052013]|uniref:hypothetical protein n=1 Tax=Streptomyces sp. NPDC052013 TaxID=3365679 RepID=UPI0037D06DE0
MHRTTTAATLLVTVAVSALTGCTTVQPTAPGPPPAQSQPPVPRPDGQAETQTVQAPAREALEMVDPSRPTGAPASPSHRAAPATPAPKGTTRSEDHEPRPRPTPDRNDTPRRPSADLSGVPDSIRRDLRGTPDVCGLGKRYGGWRADSPEAAICRNAYGR